MYVGILFFPSELKTNRLGNLRRDLTHRVLNIRDVYEVTAWIVNDCTE
jgi:hypothetical protein